MTDSNQSDGDLIAHMHNDGAPSTQADLDASPELAQELAALNELDALLQNTYGGSAQPDPQDLVDVLMEQATPSQKLIVAAYVRDSERGQREMDALAAELAGAPAAHTQPNESIIEQLARFIATPLALNLGLRAAGSESGRDREQMTFEVADLQALITLRIVPPVRERWRIEGYITQNYAPIADAQITLRSEEEPSSQSVPDDEGFFEFDALAAGRYTLEAALPDGLIVVPDITLMEQDG